MKKILTAVLFAALPALTMAQNSDNSLNMELGKGLDISLNGGEHVFNFGGYLQFDGLYTDIKDEQSETRFDIRRAYLSGGVSMFNGKLSVFTQFDFADSNPLLDAWIGYHPIKELTITVGQMQSFSGPLSMRFDDRALALDLSLVDQTFFRSGRELGIFLESRLPIRCAGIDLGLAVTSGDGRNSFGSNSMDFDLGGLKYTGRATLFPLGFFDNRTDVDFAREQRLKMSIGGTYSYNNGASDAVGEGHGTIQLYDKNGKAAYPDYQKISADIMLKYRGFTFLAEYVNATAAGLKGLYYDPAPNAQLFPKKIAEYLVLGNGLNFQAGYLFKKNWSVDLRYDMIMPEWKDKQELINKAWSVKGGVSKYFIDNRLRVQLLGTYTDMPDLSTGNKQFVAEIGAHVVF